MIVREIVEIDDKRLHELQTWCGLEGTKEWSGVDFVGTFIVLENARRFPIWSRV
jgi:hypothetical protein